MILQEQNYSSQVSSHDLHALSCEDAQTFSFSLDTYVVQLPPRFYRDLSGKKQVFHFLILYFPLYPPFIPLELCMMTDFLGRVSMHTSLSSL